MPGIRLTRRLRARFALLLALSMSLAAPRLAWSLECHVDTAQGREVRFISDAPFEDFEGVTDRIDGYVYWQGESLAAGADYEASELYFEVLLEALDTGIGLRNRHMRENYLHTEEFPYAAFKGAISEVQVLGDTAWQVSAQGTFSIHGVDQAREIRCTVNQAGTGFRLQSEFEVSLSDHDIDIPSLMFMKINEVIQVRLDLNLVAVPQGE